MTDDLMNLFIELGQHDRSVVIRRKMLSKLEKRRIVPIQYSREDLFYAMANGDIRLFSDYPSPTVGIGKSHPGKLIQSTLRNWRRKRKLKVRCGPSATIKYITNRELIDRWEAECGIVHITDLHIRDSKIESVIDPEKLSWFNLLSNHDCDAANQEMMTMVVSSRGSVSDSHSDAPDGSNYCFVGRKVWLMWDTFEGFNCGMEDNSREMVNNRCSFDMDRFLKMRSSQWLMISPGQTLFLPGDYTHKVITLEKYMGVGSFYVSLPNCLRTLSRWMVHGPVWSEDLANGQDDELVTDIAQVANRTVRRLKARSNRMQQKWGYDFLPHSLNVWVQSTPKRQQKLLKSVPAFRDYFDHLSAECV